MNIIKHKIFLSHIEMGKRTLTLGDIGIKKSKFYRHESLIFLKDLDIQKELVSNNISSGEKKL